MSCDRPELPALPRTLRWVLGRLDPHAREELRDDLRTMYGHRLRQGGRPVADRWLRREGRAALLHFLSTRLRDMRTAAHQGTSLDRLRAGSRQILRHLVRRPGFALASILSLALGIGANAGIFSLVHGIVLAPLPYPDSNRLVLLTHTAPGAGIDEMGTSLGTFVHYREHSRTLEDLAVYGETAVNLREDGEATKVGVTLVTPGFFGLFLTGPPAAGRVLRAEDGRPDAELVAVASYGFAVRRFGDPEAAVGRGLDLDGTSTRVVGVMPRGFGFPSLETELWLPRRFDPSQVRLGGFGSYGVARLREGVGLDEARREIQSLIPRLEERFAGPSFDVIVAQGRLTAVLEPLKDTVVGDLGNTLLILLGTVGFVLLVAVANVANLFLVDAEGRRREVALRKALGATDGRIAGRFLGEGAVLGAAGGVLGVLLAAIGTGLLVRLQPVDLPRLAEVRVDGAVLAFAGLLTVLSAAALAFLPILHGRRCELAPALAEGGRSSTGTRRGVRTRDVLAVAEVAAAVVLVVGAGLMVRTFSQIQRVDPGFQAADRLTFELSLQGTRYGDVATIARTHLQILDRLAEIPGVVAAGAVECLPATGCASVNSLSSDAMGPEETSAPPAVQLRSATAGYFRAMEIPVLEGRGFEAREHQVYQGAAVLSRSLAERLFPGRSPLGRGVYPSAVGNAGDDEVPWYRVVGVVGDVRDRLTDEPRETVYFAPMPSREDGPILWTVASLRYVVRTSRDPLTLVDAARAAVAEVDPTVPISRVETLDAVVARARAPAAFAMVMLSLAALVAAVLGVTGVYGVLSYGVTQRQGELGIRMALGAKRWSVRGMVLRRASWIAGLGIVLGLLGSLAVGRLIGSLLFGVSAYDPVTYALTSVGTLVVALLAADLPARRAARVSPREVLAG